jgi:hypothetical protein
MQERVEYTRAAISDTNDKVEVIQLDTCRLQETATETQSKIGVTRDVVSQVSDKMEVVHFKTR